MSGEDKASATNPIITAIAGDYVKKLVSKIGLPQAIAEKVSDIAIPFAFKLLQEKGGKDAFSLSSLTSLLGSKSSDEGSSDMLGSAIKGFSKFF